MTKSGKKKLGYVVEWKRFSDNEMGRFGPFANVGMAEQVAASVAMRADARSAEVKPVYETKEGVQ